MTNVTTSRGRLIMAVTSVLAGLFMMLAVPYLATQTLNEALHSLVEVFQVKYPDGVWDTPVPILTYGYNIWIGLMFFGGAALLILAKYIWQGEKWARPAALGILSMPSIGGLTMTVPWLVLVTGIGKPGMAPALYIMTVGLIAYYIMLLTEKADWKTKTTQIVVFSMIGLVGGFITMNAQHGVRYFLGRSSYPFLEANESNPELFLGGFVLFTATMLFPLAIGLLAARKRNGWHLALLASLVTFASQFITYLDRLAATSSGESAEWLKGSLMSLALLIILLIPFFKNRLFDQPTDDSEALKAAGTQKVHI